MNADTLMVPARRLDPDRPDAGRIADGLARLGLPAEPATVRSLADYLALLARWNTVYNLTSIRDPERMRSAHLFDSLSVLPTLRRRLPGDLDHPPWLVDVGTGAGLPGLPLALLWPELRLTLVEPVGKKVAFLRNTVGALGLLRRAEVRGCRVEQVPASDPAPDLIISRAYASLGDFVTSVEHLVGPRTRVFAMKGQLPADEIAALPGRWQVLATEPLTVPDLDAQRHLVELVRRGPESARAAAEPSAQAPAQTSAESSPLRPGHPKESSSPTPSATSSPSPTPPPHR